MCTSSTHTRFIHNLHTYMTYMYIHIHVMYVCVAQVRYVCGTWYGTVVVVANSHTYIHSCPKTKRHDFINYYYFLFLKHVCVHTHRVVFCIEVYSLVGCHVGRSVSYVCTFVCVCVADLVSIVSCYDGNCVHMTCVLCGHT